MTRNILGQTEGVPFQSKRRANDVDQAIEAFVQAVEDVKELETQRRQRILNRARALEQALAKGATLTELAGRLGVTPERVRQMRH